MNDKKSSFNKKPQIGEQTPSGSKMPPPMPPSPSTNKSK